jgi:predicted phage replisome organizer
MTTQKKYFWLKLKEDFFKTREIKKLRLVAGGDTFTIIYLKMQLLSIKKGGVIEYEETEGSFEEQLSLELDEKIENIKLTLMYLQSNKLIENVSESEFLLIKVPESIGSESDSAERVRRFRDKKQLLALRGNNEVTNSNIEIEKEINKEKDIDLETEQQKNFELIDFQAIRTLGRKLTFIEKEELEKYLIKFGEEMLVSQLRKAGMNNFKSIGTFLKNTNEKGFLILRDESDAEKLWSYEEKNKYIFDNRVVDSEYFEAVKIDGVMQGFRKIK